MLDYFFYLVFGVVVVSVLVVIFFALNKKFVKEVEDAKSKISQ